MKNLKNTPWFLLLLVVFFILHGAVENFGFIYFTELIKLAIIIISCLGLFYLLVKIFLKNTIHTALVCMFIFIWLLFFGAIFDWVKSISIFNCLHTYTIFVPFMFVSFLIFILCIRKKINLQHKLCLYLNILMLIYCTYDAGAFTLKLIAASRQTKHQPIHFDKSLVKLKPNVYLLLFDEYPGYKSLKDSFGFRNDSLYQFLENKDFKILKTFSNYNMTFYSMASMLNMQYIDKPFIPLQNTMENDQQRIKEIKSALAVQYFISMGYSFTNYSIFDILDKPSRKSTFVISETELITNKIFFVRLWQDIGWNFLNRRLPLLYEHYKIMQEDRNNKFFEKKLLNYKPNRNLPPQIVYAHFNMPHHPIYYDSVGNYLPTETFFKHDNYYNKQKFLSQLKYTNSKIKNLVTALTTNDPNAIVIVMSDHGYRGYNNTTVKEPLHFNNICAVRLPNKNYFPINDSIGSVNFFRYLFNDEFNQKISYLNDSTIFLKDIQP